MGKPKRNPQKERRDDQFIYNANPSGEGTRARKYQGEAQEQKDNFLIEQVVNPNIDPYSERVNYGQIAKEKNIKKITNKNKEWILIDGTEVESSSLKSKWKYFKPGDSRSAYNPSDMNPFELLEERREDVGTYDMNNGVITFVDERGDRYVAPDSDERRRVLKSAGYRHKGQFVPCSNGELPIDPELRKKFLKGFHRQSQIGDKFMKKTLEHHVTTALFFGFMTIALSILALNTFGISDFAINLSPSITLNQGLFSLPLILLFSILFGVTMKLADCFNEHGFRWFKGDAIFFGILFGLFGGLLILSNFYLTNLFFALLLVNILRFRVDAFNHGIAAIIMFFSFLLVMNNFNWSYFLYFFLTFAIFGILFNYVLPLSKIKGFWGTIFELRFFYFLITLLFSIYTTQWIVFLSMALFQIGYNLTFYYARKSRKYKKVEDYFSGD